MFEDEFGIKKRFSERHSLQPDIQPAPIVYRQELPSECRRKIISLAKGVASRLNANGLREFLCRVLNEIPDTANNWSEPNIIQECFELIEGCEWYQVYDFCEAFEQKLSSEIGGSSSFERALNIMFLKEGIGWQMKDGLILVRGDEDFESIIVKAHERLETMSLPSSASQLSEALKDLSRRPEPDLTGAIHHGIAALECFAREVSGETNKTLGGIVPMLSLPPVLAQAVQKMWGFASNTGRHVKEGQVLEYADAQLTVHFAASLIAYLSERKR